MSLEEHADVLAPDARLRAALFAENAARLCRFKQ